MIALPPSLDGADHDTNAIDDAGLAATPCGADGTPAARAGDAARSSAATIVAPTAKHRHEDGAISEQTIGMAQSLRATESKRGAAAFGRTEGVSDVSAHGEASACAAKACAIGHGAVTLSTPPLGKATNSTVDPSVPQ